MALSKIADAGLDLTAAAIPVLNSSSMPAGSVLQVVQGTTTNVAATTSTSYISTTLGASITPTSASSKILVVVSSSYYHSQANYGAFFTILRNGSNVVGATGWGDFYGNNSIQRIGFTLSYLDAPATTSSTAYALGMKAESASYTVYSPTQSGALGTIILMEIAG